MPQSPLQKNHAAKCRGAMFGLDARIALSIFAVLALTVGYMAFGRIQSAQQAKLYKTLTSFEEALAAYQTDMGTFYLFTLDKTRNDEGRKDLEALWDKSIVLPGFQKLWNGPYLHNTTRTVPPYGRLSVFYAQSDRKNTCSTESDCYIWLALSNVPADIWQSLNRIVDENGGKNPERGGLDIETGRLQADNATDPRLLIYRTVARPR